MLFSGHIGSGRMLSVLGWFSQLLSFACHMLKIDEG